MIPKGHVPIRLCIGCRKRKEKKEMIRFTWTTEGRAKRTEGKNQNGRGFYLCPEESCLKAAIQKRRIVLLDDDPLISVFKQKLIEGVKEERECQK